MKLIKPDSGNISFGMDKVNNAYPIGYLGMESRNISGMMETAKILQRFVGASVWGKILESR